MEYNDCVSRKADVADCALPVATTSYDKTKEQDS